MKISKASAGFQCKPDTEYTCKDCIALRGTSGCALIGAGVKISSASGGCNYFMHGESDQVPWQGIYPAVELGYAENKYGFSCKRCEYFKLSGDCEKVDRQSPGAAPGEIQPNTCCNFWEPDEERAKMPTDKLLIQIANAAEKAKNPQRVEDKRGYWTKSR